MTVKTYDPQCLTLAEHFLREEPCAFNPITFRAHCHSLALTIQEAVEDWAYEPEAEVPAAAEIKWHRLPPGECSFCDKHRNNAMMPSHTASARCESGHHRHCTCSICF